MAPLVIFCAFVLAATLDQHPLVGPDPASWFLRVGVDVSYGVPLILVAIGLVGHAILDRSSPLAFAAGVLANIAATLTVLWRLVKGGGSLDPAAWILVAQANSIVAGVWALAWLAAAKWRQRAAEPAEPSRDTIVTTPRKWPILLYAQAGLATALCGIFLFPAVVRIAFGPSVVGWAATADGLRGWAALTLAAAATLGLYGVRDLSQHRLAVFIAGLVALVALTAARWDSGNWLAYYSLLAGCCLAQWLLPVTPRLVSSLYSRISSAALETTAPALAPIAWASVWTRLFEAAAVTLALRSLQPNLYSPWGAVLAISVTSVRNIWIAWYEDNRGSMWLAALLANLAASVWWIDSGYRLTGSMGVAVPMEFVWLNVLVAAAMAIVSAALNWRSASSVTLGPGRRAVGFHRFAAWAAVILLFCTTAFGLAADLLGSPIQTSALLNWAAWTAALAVVVACLWDGDSRWPVACLYSVGLVAIGVYLDGLNFTAPMFHWALANSLAAYSLITAYLWNRRQRIQEQLARWQVPTAVAAQRAQSQSSLPWFVGSSHAWLVSAGLVLAAAVLYLVTWVEILMPTYHMRMIAAYAVGAEALALAFLAQGTVRSPLQYTSLIFGALFAVAFGCAWLPPEFDAVWLHRAVAAATALAVMTAVYGLGLVKLFRRDNEWTRAAQRLVPPILAAATSLLVVILTHEVVAFAHGRGVPMVWPARIAVVVALVALAAAALIAALVPGRDPLGLSERGRTVYVYAAEVLAALAFVHIRVTMPWLFSGWFLQFWPLVIMAIAFVGVGLSEFFQRRRQTILAEPLTNTGALLPLLPALGCWITSSQVHYSLVLLAVGALYASLSVLRKSFLFAVLAAVAANVSLWYLLYHADGFGIARHPQLWLIPPALCMLAAGYLNRSRLTAEQLAALRYGSAIVIYASSTGDVFINGVAQAPWLPAVLALLSIAGVFAGILLRVRGFLYLGTAFLLIAIMSVIWQAAEGRVWVYWIAGLVTGVLILILFGIFEKRRDDMLRLVERLKQWEA